MALTAGSLLGGGLTTNVEMPVLGCHLAADLGDDYLCIGVTAGGGRTSSRRADPAAPGGVATFTAELGPPAEGSSP